MPNASPYNGSYQLEFEKPLLEIEKQIRELERNPNREEYFSELQSLRQSHTGLLKKTYAKLSPWQTVQVARHPGRPQSADYIATMVKDFQELHGDRRFGDDRAILTGFGRIGPYKTMLVAQNKGRDTKEKIAANFGCAHPEGYRKAMAKMKLAEKFEMPVVCLIDTAGAYPGVGSEQRGVAEAIAVNLRDMSKLRVPIVCVVIGEGGSGGALGIAVGDRVGMMQYAWYSVISPENCSAILWRDGDHAEVAAASLCLTARDNLKHGVIDSIIEEPLGGAHRDPAQAAATLEDWIVQHLRELRRFKIDNLIRRRYERWRELGAVAEGAIA